MGEGGGQAHSQGHFKVILTDTNPEQDDTQLTFTVHLCDICHGPALYSNGTCVVLLTNFHTSESHSLSQLLFYCCDETR